MDLALLKGIATALAGERSWPPPRYVNAGASGAVFELHHPAHGRVALKIYDPRFFEGENALIEEERLNLQRRLAGRFHPHLIRTIETGPAAGHGTWYLLMDFLPWRDLSEVVGIVPDARVAPLIAQLASAVVFLRDLGLVHRDIKPANIAVAPDWSELKLLDLGVLRAIGVEEGVGTDADGKERFVATAQYSPPEYLAREEPPGEAGFDALNVYQVGAVLHDLIMKRPLFDEEARSLVKLRLYRAVLSKMPEVFSAGVSARLNSLCRAALHKDPHVRIGAVAVTDFERREDSPGDLRRRLAGHAVAKAVAGAPSLLEWRGRVREWLAAAAAAERDTLGALDMRSVGDTGAAWELRFDQLAAVLPARLTPDGEALRLLLGTGESVRSALEIDTDGPSVPASQIPAQLSEQILVALDEAGSSPMNTGEAV